jgi:hypothetical protein
MDLPTFGKLTKEYWGILEPHIKFALALDHPHLKQGRFRDRQTYWKAALTLAQIVGADDLPTSGRELVETIKPLISVLTYSAPRQVGPIIQLNPATHKAFMTTNGERYLSDCVKNALIEVDDSRKQR